jgi:Rieske Fe-S protein
VPWSVVAHSALCTHQGCAVVADGRQLTCPCHGSVFSAASGQVLNGPADSPLASVPVSVHDGGVSVG